MSIDFDVRPCECEEPIWLKIMIMIALDPAASVSAQATTSVESFSPWADHLWSWDRCMTATVGLVLR
eukprot:scaffold52579_cov60-Cyclotella_meneghiniana.AAC.2